MRGRAFMRSAMAMCLMSTACVVGAENRGFHIGAGLGTATSEAANPTQGANFKDSDTSFRLLGGYSISKYFALEASYLDGGVAEDSVGPFALELETSVWSLAAVGTWPIGRWDLSAKLGYAFYDADQTIRLGNLSESGSKSDSDVAGGVAAAFRVTPRFSVRMEYETIRLTGGKFDNLSLNGVLAF